MVLGDVEGLKTKRAVPNCNKNDQIFADLGLNQNVNMVRLLECKEKGYIPCRRKACWRNGGRRAGTCADRWTRRWHWRGHGVGNEEPRTVACSLGLAIGK